MKGYEHDEACRPHRPSGRAFAVRRDAAGRLRRTRHRREVRALGPGADRPRRCGRRAAQGRVPRRQRHDPPQGAGRADGRSPDRGGARDRRGQHDHLGGQAPGRPQHRRGRLQVRARQAGRAPEDAEARPWCWAPAAGPGRSSTGSSARGSSGSSCSTATSIGRRAWSSTSRGAPPHMELRAMPWHESIIESELAKTKVLVNATSIGLTTDDEPRSRPRSCTAELMVLDLIYAADPPAARCRTRPARRPSDGELMLLHQGAAAFTLWTGQPAPLELMQTKLAEARAGGLRSAEGEPPTGRTGGRWPPPSDRIPLPDGRGDARSGPRCHRRGRAGRPVPDRGRRSRSTSPGVRRAMAAAPARPSSRTVPRSWAASATA